MAIRDEVVGYHAIAVIDKQQNTEKSDNVQIEYLSFTRGREKSTFQNCRKQHPNNTV